MSTLFWSVGMTSIWSINSRTASPEIWELTFSLVLVA